MAKVKVLPQSKFITCNEISLEEFHKKRNRLLIIRQTGGLGDILMCRMMFEDFKNICPDVEIYFACPKDYHPVLKDHPYIDHVVDVKDIDHTEFIVSYNISTACGKYEVKKAPFSDKNRSDIWANHCGVHLENHNMHLQIDKSRTKTCRQEMESYRKDEKGPLVLLCPISAMVSKNLDKEQMNGVLEELRKKDCLVLGLHKSIIKELETETIVPNYILDYLSFIDAADYIVTVDTASFHAAGGLSKPTVAIFSWADGKMYGKWYDNYILVQRHRDNGNWDCGPCYCWFNCPKERNTTRKPCITEITVEEIMEAYDEMLERWPWSDNGK